jgi:hypothetical protein
MHALYRHTQFGVTLTLALASIALVLVAIALWSPLRLGASIALVVVVASLVLCHSLTTVLYADHLHCFFGFGVIQRRIPLSEIEAVTRVRSSPFDGWGLRMISGGWLWNVSGLDAIELRLRNGRRFRIGSDEAAVLEQALRLELSRAEQKHSVPGG